MCFLVALTIAAYHFMQQFPNSLYAYNGWQMGVEFFYILSGLLLAKSAERSEGTGFSYTWKSIKSIYLLYFLTMLFNLIVYCIDTHKSFISMAGRSVMSFLFLQESVRGVVGFLPPNGPAWFLSGLIVMGLAVYEFKQRFAPFLYPAYCPLFRFAHLHLLFAEGGRNSGLEALCPVEHSRHLSARVRRAVPRLPLLGDRQTDSPCSVDICGHSFAESV